MLNQNPDEFVLKQIKNLCNERNWSLYRLSMESSIPYSTLNNLFRRGNVPSINTLCKICDAFRISLSEFFSGNNDALSSLNPEQKNLIGCWNLLSKEDKNLVKDIYMRAAKYYMETAMEQVNNTGIPNTFG